MFKYISLVVLALLVSSCDKANSHRENFLHEIEGEINSGTSIKSLVLKIRDEKLLSQRNNHSAAVDIELEPTETNNNAELYYTDAEYTMFISNIKNNECADVFSFIINDDPINSFYHAYLYEVGICYDYSPEEAVKIYTELENGTLNSPHSAVRLGNLYLTGEGVELNPEIATQFFKNAVVSQASQIWLSDEFPEYINDEQSLGYKIWGDEYIYPMSLFYNVATGPWKLPEPIFANINWIRGLIKGDGSEIFEIANHIYDGTGGYKKNLYTAIDWMTIAELNFHYKDADYYSALWQIERDNNIALNRPPTEIGLSAMKRAACKGSLKALTYMINYHQNYLDQPWANWGLLQYIILKQNNGHDVEQELVENVRNSLNSLEQQIIKYWVNSDFKRPITEHLPK